MLGAREEKEAERPRTPGSIPTQDARDTAKPRDGPGSLGILLAKS